MDLERYNSESEKQFNYWFDGLQALIAKYSIEPENTFNMDERGFLIGYLTKARRIFANAATKNKKHVSNRQDSSRE